VTSHLLPWLLVVFLFFVAVRQVITWAWLPWLICAGLVVVIGALMHLMGGMFRR
jgi:hypothetical protein